MMATSGVGWTVMFIGMLLLAQGDNKPITQFSSLIGAGFALWLMTHFIWTIWLGVWLWQKAGIYQLDNPVTTS
jgi:hypothetical protein